ncbi:major facilitator superfamily protein [Paenibacillus mucilaginosus 3016]|uniref:Major facilitator superfamily protein n=2 Tax=Paenibacillus mucilaginosus TaxID=61624 RepID=H6NJC5_9BACL|nr:MFS transporter [Paenibacillus mucilaginosus]AFC29204.1 major facilitator superfamily protein [Paenibacillus mucilaginosus 3016]AFH61377.2 MFS transporter [Paenibacillus mucilaginosus K02]WFA17937.1 MFS transporter [Paenibacillus mucilaginosus]
MANESLSRPPQFPILTGILFWCSLLVVSSVYLTIPLVELFAEEFRVSPSEAAWAGSAFSFAFAGGGLFFGVLSDRFGRKKMMMSGLLLLTVVTPLIGTAGDLSWLIFLRAIQGLAASMFPPSVLAYAMEMFPPEKRVGAIGVISTAFLMASIGGQLYSSSVVLHFSWPYVFHFLSAGYLISFLLVACLVPVDGAPKAVGSFFSPFRRIPAIFQQKSLPLCYIISATLFISLVGFFATLGSYLNSPLFGLGHQEILWVRAVGIIGMFVSLFDGRLVAKIGVKNVVWCGLLIACIGLGLLGLWPSLPFLIVMSVVFITGIAVTLPALISLIGQLAGDLRAIAVSFHMFMLFIGASLGPILSIALVDAAGHLPAFLVLTALLGLSMLVPVFIRLDGKGQASSANRSSAHLPHV